MVARVRSCKVETRFAPGVAQAMQDMLLQVVKQDARIALLEESCRHRDTSATPAKLVSCCIAAHVLTCPVFFPLYADLAATQQAQGLNHGPPVSSSYCPFLSWVQLMDLNRHMSNTSDSLPDVKICGSR